jgi:hypothetical protein
MTHLQVIKKSGDHPDDVSIPATNFVCHHTHDADAPSAIYQGGLVTNELPGQNFGCFLEYGFIPFAGTTKYTDIFHRLTTVKKAN